MPDYAALTARQKAVWSSGDWPAVAPTIVDASAAVVDALGVAEGHDYLDVATGSATAAIMGQQRGARTHGARLRARADRVRARGQRRVEWVWATPQDLPFDDAPSIACRRCSARCSRPTRPRPRPSLSASAARAGSIAVTAWTPEGVNGGCSRRSASTCRLRPRASSRRSCGAPRTACASCSPGDVEMSAHRHLRATASSAVLRALGARARADGHGQGRAGAGGEVGGRPRRVHGVYESATGDRRRPEVDAEYLLTVVRP